MAAFPVKMTDGFGAKRHPLIAPISPRNLAAAHLLRHPITADELARVLGVSDKSLRAVLDGKRPSVKFARAWRLHVGDDLVAAWRKYRDWKKADEKLAKERER